MTDHVIDFEEKYKSGVSALLPGLLGVIADPVVLLEHKHVRREKVVMADWLFEGHVLVPENLNLMCNAYMACSYAVNPQKHEIKRTFNKLIKRLLSKHLTLPTVEEIAGRRTDRYQRTRPVILVPLERFTSGHSMYRSYAPVLKQLKQTFKLVALSPEGGTDPVSERLFDSQIQYVAQSPNIGQILKKVKDLDPDMVYYPSIGMSQICVMLSNIRLAPIQIMSPGHPASSLSSEIDYAIMEESEAWNVAWYERVLTVPDGALQYVSRLDFKLPPNEEDKDVVKIAVPAMAQKVNLPYVHVLKQIIERAEVKTELHFFPNVITEVEKRFSQTINQIFGNAVVHSSVLYPEYLLKLTRCQLHLSTVPFGCTNTIVDSLLLGLPVVNLKMPPHSHGMHDAVMIDQAGLSSTSTCKNQHQYILKASTLINEPEYRQDVVEKIKQKNISEVFFGERDGPRKNAFLDAFKHVYENHEKLKEERRIEWRSYR